VPLVSPGLVCSHTLYEQRLQLVVFSGIVPAPPRFAEVGGAGGGEDNIVPGAVGSQLSILMDHAPGPISSWSTVYSTFRELVMGLQQSPTPNSCRFS
jgi:hypothetical protein